MIAHKDDIGRGTGAAARPGLGTRLNPIRLLQRVAKRGAYMHQMIHGALRRSGWFVEQLTFRRLMNMATTGVQFFLKSERMHALPVIVKIDISPMCNLSCTTCVHADPHGDPQLEKQEFKPQHRMSVEQFRRIIDEIRGKASAVSLYYVGDPLVHPDLDEMCSIARDAKLNVHISTNFSFSLTDARLKRMIDSGLTHLTVCVDGLSQKKYELTRVGGRIERVLNNLERMCRFRRELGRTYPKIEVQYIKFQHNVDELEPARNLLLGWGIDQFTDFWGDLGNYVDRDPGTFRIIGPRENKRIPQCYWPHGNIVIKYNGDVIPCCTYRIGQQYTASDDARVLGNVFQSSVREVWNNEKYRQARRMVSNPQSVLHDPALKDHFCYGCPAIFETTSDTPFKMANHLKWEEHYELGADGRPIPKHPHFRPVSVTQVGLPSGEMASV